MGAFFYFILFGLVVAVIGGVLQGIHNSKRQSPPPLNKKFSLGGSITREQLSHIQAENRKRGTALQHCVELNNRGIAYEKMGKIEDAIATYEINISIGYTAHHAYKRLMILYRKQKDYHNERRVIIRALEVFPAEMEYLDRLRKVEYLILEAVLISFDKSVKHDLDECNLYHSFCGFSKEFIIDGQPSEVFQP